GKEYGGEELVLRARPVERSAYRIAAADLLGRQALDLAVRDVLDALGCVGLRRRFVAQGCRPHRQGSDWLAVLRYRRLDRYHVAVAEHEALPRGHAMGGVLEHKLAGGRNCTGGAGDVERRVQLVTQVLVVGKQRERQPVLAAFLADEIERTATVVFVLLQHP